MRLSFQSSVDLASKFICLKSHIKWWFKLWGRSDSDGFMYDFDVYQPVPDDQVSELGRSAGVVEKMTDSFARWEKFQGLR